MTAWSLGFIFDARLEWVCLIKKGRTLHVGLWNGIGGKIEGSETPAECMARECKEEAQLDIYAPFWESVGSIGFPNGDRVHVFATWIKELRDHMMWMLKATPEAVAQMKADEPRAVPFRYHLGSELHLYQLAPHAEIFIHASTLKFNDPTREPLHIEEVATFP